MEDGYVYIALAGGAASDAGTAVNVTHATGVFTRATGTGVGACNNVVLAEYFDGTAGAIVKVRINRNAS